MPIVIQAVDRINGPTCGHFRVRVAGDGPPVEYDTTQAELAAQEDTDLRALVIRLLAYRQKQGRPLPGGSVE